MIRRLPHRPPSPPPTPRAGPLAPVVPIGAARRRGGRQWRKDNGLETIADLVDSYLARHFVRDGALCTGYGRSCLPAG